MTRAPAPHFWETPFAYKPQLTQCVAAERDGGAGPMSLKKRPTTWRVSVRTFAPEGCCRGDSLNIAAPHFRPVSFFETAGLRHRNRQRRLDGHARYELAATLTSKITTATLWNGVAADFKR
jgi:hypothetical protein